LSDTAQPPLKNKYVNSVNIWYFAGLLHQLQLLQQMTSTLEGGRGGGEEEEEEEEEVEDKNWYIIEM
jgi:hypothetical protein